MEFKLNSVSGLFLQVELRVRSVGWSVSLSVYLLIPNVYCEKTADSFEMPFGVVGLVGLRNHVLDGDSDLPR